MPEQGKVSKLCVAGIHQLWFYGINIRYPMYVLDADLPEEINMPLVIAYIYLS